MTERDFVINYHGINGSVLCANEGPTVNERKRKKSRIVAYRLF